MYGLDERCTCFLVILLGQLTESEANPVPHQLVCKGSAHPYQQECPIYMFQHTLVFLLNQIAYIFSIRSRRLPLPEGHVANATGNFDNFFRFCRFRRALPLNSLLLEE
jgi:hypothetical protein